MDTRGIGIIPRMGIISESKSELSAGSFPYDLTLRHMVHAVEISTNLTIYTAFAVLTSVRGIEANQPQQMLAKDAKAENKQLSTSFAFSLRWNVSRWLFR
jgi:hypothetical protein